MTYKMNLTMPGYYGKKTYPGFKYTAPTTMQAVKELEVVFPTLINVEFL